MQILHTIAQCTNKMSVQTCKKVKAAKTLLKGQLIIISNYNYNNNYPKTLVARTV